MITGKISNGFKYKIGDNALKDYRFVLALSKWEKDPSDFSQFDNMMIYLMGEEQRTKFVESFMDKENNVPSDVLAKGFRELLEDAKKQSEELKNS